MPDLLVEESGPLARLCRRADFNLIQLITPTTSRERALRIAETSTGFIYYVSVTVITGERTELPPALMENVAWLKQQTPVPVAIGFGISKPEHVRALAPVADGLIVGSAIVRRIAAASPNSAVPTTSSLAPSGTCGHAVRAALVVATIGECVETVCAIGTTPCAAEAEWSPDSRDNAKPTGTTTAATTAARIRIRIRFRIAARATSSVMPRVFSRPARAFSG